MMTSPKKKWVSPEICDIFDPLYYGRIERMHDDCYHIIAELVNLDILFFTRMGPIPNCCGIKSSRIS